MRRWLLLLLLTVLPLQFATAAAASYCRHEAGSAKHFGHHEHQHEGTGEHKSTSNSPDGNSHQSTNVAGDSDCEYCHLGAAHPLLRDFTQPGSGLKAAPMTQPVLSLGTRDPDTLDRPNWVSLV